MSPHALTGLKCLLRQLPTFDEESVPDPDTNPALPLLAFVVLRSDRARSTYYHFRIRNLPIAIQSNGVSVTHVSTGDSVWSGPSYGSFVSYLLYNDF